MIKTINGYNLEVEPNESKNVLKIVVEGDSNDADYLNKDAEIELAELSKEQLTELFEAIGKIGTVLQSTGERCNNWTDEMKEIENTLNCYDIYLPYGEYGCNDIEVTELQYIDENGSYFEVSL